MVVQFIDFINQKIIKKKMNKQIWQWREKKRFFFKLKKSKKKIRSIYRFNHIFFLVDKQTKKNPDKWTLKTNRYTHTHTHSKWNWLLWIDTAMTNVCTIYHILWFVCVCVCMCVRRKNANIIHYKKWVEKKYQNPKKKKRNNNGNDQVLVCNRFLFFSFF